MGALGAPPAAAAAPKSLGLPSMPTVADGALGSKGIAGTATSRGPAPGYAGGSGTEAKPSTCTRDSEWGMRKTRTSGGIHSASGVQRGIRRTHSGEEQLHVRGTGGVHIHAEEQGIANTSVRTTNGATEPRDGTDAPAGDWDLKIMPRLSCSGQTEKKKLTKNSTIMNERMRPIHNQQHRGRCADLVPLNLWARGIRVAARPRASE